MPEKYAVLQPGDVARVFATAATETNKAVWDYWMNSAFLEGRQWLRKITNDRVAEVDPGDDLQLVDNVMLANHRTIMGLLLQRPLQFENKARSYTSSDIRGASIARNLVTNVADDHAWGEMKRKLATAVLKGGTAALAVDYDKDKGDTIERVLTIADFVLEPGVRQVADARWWIRVQLIPSKTVQHMYGLSEPPPAVGYVGLNNVTIESTGVTKDNTDLVPVFSYYERPVNGKGGRIITEAGGKWVEKNDWGFPFDHLNLAIVVDVDRDDTWVGQASYSSARSPQVGRNYIVTGLAEHLQNVTDTMLLVPAEARSAVENRTQTPGEHVYLPAGSTPPTWLTQPPLSGWYQNLPGLFGESLDTVMSVKDVSRGEAPVNLESAAAIQTLHDLGATPISLIVDSISQAFTSLGRMSLQILQQQGSNRHSPAVRNTPLMPVKDIGENWRVVVPTDTQIPRTAAARRQEAMVLLQMNVITSLDEYAKAVETPDLARVVETINPDIAKARTENLMARAGNLSAPDDFDDHAIHIDEHNRERKSADWLGYSDQQKTEMNQHIQGHEAMAAEAAARSVMQTEEDPSGTLASTPTGAPMPVVPNPDALAPPPPTEPPPPPPAPEREEFDPETGASAIEALLQ